MGPHLLSKANILQLKNFSHPGQCSTLRKYQSHNPLPCPRSANRSCGQIPRRFLCFLPDFVDTHLGLGWLWLSLPSYSAESHPKPNSQRHQQLSPSLDVHMLFYRKGEKLKYIDRHLFVAKKTVRSEVTLRGEVVAVKSDINLLKLKVTINAILKFGTHFAFS